MQMHKILREKLSIMIYLILLGLVLFNFVSNMNLYHNADITQMMDPLKLSALSTYSKTSFYLMQFYPILVVVPTAGYYLSDRNTQVSYYIQSRVGLKNYIAGKAITVFLCTFIIFAVPFLLEIVAYFFVIPHVAQGDPSNFQYYQTIEGDSTLFMSDLYYAHRYLYAFFMILIFSLASSVFACFNFSLTLTDKIKFRIFTYFPIYIVIYLISILSMYIGIPYVTNYFIILPLYSAPVGSNYALYALFFSVLFLISVIFVFYKIRKKNNV